MLFIKVGLIILEEYKQIFACIGWNQAVYYNARSLSIWQK